jgi:hypothetical protein
MYDDEDDLARPTPEQIRKKCLQKTWTDFQRAYRAGLIRGEPRNWKFFNGRSHCYETEFFWTAPQYLVHHGEIGRSDDRRYRELRVWDRVG